MLVQGLWLRNRQPLPFDLRFAQTGGEDFDFFKWVEHQGGKFVWADTAEIYEEVPLDRQRLSYIFERCLRTSITYWRSEYAANTKLWAIRKATIGFIGGNMYFLMGCFLLPFGISHLVNQWSKSIKGFARIVALSKLTLIGYGKTQ